MAMASRLYVLTTIIAAALLSAAVAQAQGRPRWRGGGGWDPGGAYGGLYDPQTVETAAGEVVALKLVKPMRGMSPGVHLELKTEKETIWVHLGPEWFIVNQDIRIEPKDKVEIRGSRITFAGKPALIAAEVRKGDEVLKLRDEKTGVPVWSGWRRR